MDHGGATSSTVAASYHVFLSFEAASKHFVDHLYTALMNAGIRTFRNDDELGRRENIESKMHRAVKESRISIIICSKDYGSSRLCLEELVNLLERKKAVGHMILPVFYDVDPSHVRKQKGDYEKAFLKHVKLMMGEPGGMDKIQRWRTSLKEVADLAGMVAEDGNESKFIQKIVEETWNKLSRTVLSVARYPVGIYSRVKDISLWLQEGSTKAGIVMIYGIAGMGKTTIAKTVYDLNFEQFDGSSFLSDIRVTSKNTNGLVCLQRKLLSDVLKGKRENVCNIDEGIVEIKDALCCKKVLIVLDDVDQLDQLNALLGTRDFCPGSKIIITTTEKRLLKAHDLCRLFKVKELDSHESLQLFCWHAFGQGKPMKGYIKYSKTAIHLCQGLPLALQILGSSLLGRNLDFWGSALDKLEKSSEFRIMKVLELGYESLQDDSERNLFLDIACFFVGKYKDYTIKILDECEFYTVAGIQNLIDRNLLTVTKDNKLMMHQLLQEMGKEIIRRESPREPGKRSRLWDQKDTFDVLKEETGTESIEGLSISLDATKEDNPSENVICEKRKRTEIFSYEWKEFAQGSSLKRICMGFFSKLWSNSGSTELFPTSNDVNLRIDAFSRMHKLRLLQINNVWLTGRHEGFPKNLRWLCWQRFRLKSLRSDFHLENLVVLEMRYSNMEQAWEGIKFFRALKILDLSHSHSLIRTPNFSGLPNLERLILKECTSLVKVHESIGALNRLVCLNLRGCKNLTRLPRETFELKSLQKLILCGCSNLELCRYLCKSLYSYIWSWPSFRSTSVSYSLKSLDLSNCNMTDSIPFDFSILSSLEHLNLSRNHFFSLPESIKGLTALQSLVMVKCKRLRSLSELPLSLKTLDARSCQLLERITNFPDSLKAQDLQLKDCGKLVEVQGLFKLVHMVNVDEAVSMLGLVDLDVIGETEVELFNYLTYIKRKCPVQGLYEFGIFSIFLPGSTVPCFFNKKTTGSPISFNLPSLPNLKIQGLNICTVYAQNNEENGGVSGHYVKISNETKGLKWIYGPVLFAIPGASETMLWLSHWKFIDQLEAGDLVIVSLSTGYDVKELGIEFVYKDKVDETVGHQCCSHSFQEINGGDIADYRLSKGVYLLSHCL